jgi:ketosteroid isomerase-like protein
MLQALLTFAAIVAASGADANSAQAAINARNQAFVDAFVRGDAHAIAMQVEESATFVSGGKTFIGRSSVESFLKASMQQGLPSSGQCTTDHLDVVGSRAFESGKCTLSFTTPKAFDYSYNYLALWHQQPDGSWLLAADVSP